MLMGKDMYFMTLTTPFAGLSGRQDFYFGHLGVSVCLIVTLVLCWVRRRHGADDGHNLTDGHSGHFHPIDRQYLISDMQCATSTTPQQVNQPTQQQLQPQVTRVAMDNKQRS